MWFFFGGFQVHCHYILPVLVTGLNHEPRSLVVRLGAFLDRGMTTPQAQNYIIEEWIRCRSTRKYGLISMAFGYVFTRIYLILESFLSI